MRWGTAEEAGLDPERLWRAWQVVASHAGTEAIPAAVAAVGRAGVGVGPLAIGYAVWAPEQAREPVAPDTVFDLASLTKPVATASVCWALVERGRLRPGDRVAELLPAFATPQPGEDRSWRRQVTLWHLLTHTSGLPSHRDLWAAAGDPAGRLAAVAQTPLRMPPGVQVMYSDLGFILLGHLLEVVTGSALDRLAEELIFGPLGMRDTGFAPSAARARRAAATEWAAGPQAPSGGAGYLRGVVHDENARALGGVAGHAGLFSTARDLSLFADMLRAGGVGGEGITRRVLAVATVARLTEPVIIGERDGRTPGWQAAGRTGAPWGDLWSPRAYGHTGFTGTSLWIDPVYDLWVVLLTNAVHMGRTRGRVAVARLRAALHNAAVAALA